jgi:hypothetical protein
MIKKAFVISALLGVAAASQAQVVIYDTMTGVTNGYIPGTPRFLNGDIGNTDALPSWANQWRVTGIDFSWYAHLVANYAASDLQFRIRFYDSHNAAAPTGTSVMTNMIGNEIIYNVGAVNNTAVNTRWNTTNVNAQFTNANIVINGTDFGFDVRAFKRDANGQYVATDEVSLAGVGSTTTPMIGSSPAGVYRDVNNNGILESGTELRFATNTPLRVRFESVRKRFPSPARWLLSALAPRRCFADADASRLSSPKRKSRPAQGGSFLLLVARELHAHVREEDIRVHNPSPALPLTLSLSSALSPHRHDRDGEQGEAENQQCWPHDLFLD